MVGSSHCTSKVRQVSTNSLPASEGCGRQAMRLKLIPAIIRRYTLAEAAEIALIENLQREDLDAIEEGLAYDRLMTEFGLTQEQTAQKVGKSRSHVANMVRLLQLPEAIKSLIVEGKLSMGQTRPLLQLPTEKQQCEAALYILKYELSARKAEAFVRRYWLRTVRNGSPMPIWRSYKIG